MEDIEIKKMDWAYNPVLKDEAVDLKILKSSPVWKIGIEKE